MKTSEAGNEGREDQAALRRVEAALRAYHADYEPAADWQARVLAKVRQRAEAPARRPWWQLALPVMAAAAAALALMWWRSAPTPGAPQLAMVVKHKSGVSRGPSVRLGDELQLTARGGDGGHRALWLYRGRGELLATCPGHAGCARDEAGLSLAFSPGRVGEYTVVAVWSATPLPAPTGSLDDELALASRAEAVVRKEVFIVD